MRRPLRRHAVVALAAGALTAGTVTATMTGGEDLAPPPATPAAPSEKTPAARSGTGGVPVSFLPYARTSGRAPGAVDTRSRAAVEQAYAEQWAAHSGLETGWTGDHDACDEGTVTEESIAAMLEAVNFARSLNGLEPVRTDPTLDAAAQRTSLLMAANRNLSHAPPRDWACWTQAGADTAATSNLALSLPRMSVLRAMELYLDEPGAHNTAVGHRRWMMNPFAEVIGMGATDTAHTMTVIGGPQDQGNANPRWTSWPSSGWFPAPLEPDGRWSVSSGRTTADFSRARVVVREVRGSRLQVTRETPLDGFAMPTLVFDVTGVQAGKVYRVTVKNVRGVGKGKKKRRTSFKVGLFEPRG